MIYNLMNTPRHSERGIILLLVVVLVAAILSVSLGVFNMMLGEFRISGDAADSFRALYAADEGFERTLYKDRQQGPLCSGIADPCVPIVMANVPSGACYEVRVARRAVAPRMKITVTGQYQCGVNPLRVVRRAFEAVY